VYNCLRKKFFAINKNTPSLANRKGGEVKVDILAAFVLSIVAGVIANCISKRLDEE